jgi:hypothetical protein
MPGVYAPGQRSCWNVFRATVVATCPRPRFSGLLLRRAANHTGVDSRTSPVLRGRRLDRPKRTRQPSGWRVKKHRNIYVPLARQNRPRGRGWQGSRADGRFWICASDRTGRNSRRRYKDDQQEPPRQPITHALVHSGMKSSFQWETVTTRVSLNFLYLSAA